MNFKSRKFMKVFLLTCLMISSLQSLFIEPIEAAEEERLWKTADILYDANLDNLKKSHHSVFYKEKTLKSKPFSLDAGSGKIITKIVLKKDGTSYRTINVNSQKYTDRISLDGQGVPVKSANNQKNGSWFAWERGSRDVHWKPGGGNNYTLGNITTPGSDTVNGFLRDKWPGRLITQPVIYTRENPYVSVGSVDYGQFTTKYIDNDPLTLKAANPFQNGVNVSIVDAVQVTSPTGITGYTDPTTIIKNMKVLDLDQAEITFTQDHGHEGERVNLGTPGAAMMYYFAFYRYDIKTFTYRYPDVYEVYIKDGDGEDPKPPDPGGIGSCTWTIQPPSQASAPQTVSMDPKATGVIKADDPSNSPYRFDVGQGIPTSEYLYANTLGLNYLFQHTFGNMIGKIKYDCSVDLKYVLNWKIKQDPITGPDGKPKPVPDKPMTRTESKNYSFSFIRDYDYWKINNLEVYKINNATMSNYALPSGKVTINPTGYIPPTSESKHSESVNDHVYPKETGRISFSPPPQDGGYDEPTPDDHSDVLKGMAESQTKDADVHNDRVNFNGELIMNDEMATKKAPMPGKIKESLMIGDRVLYLDKQLIRKTLINKANELSSGTLFYDLLDGHVGGSVGKNYPINHINTVTVHTPVVNYSSVTDDKEHNQKTTPNKNRAAFILDRPFTVRIPTAGQHVQYPGYGNRDYAKYIMTKQVYFPFDVYNAARTQFIPKDTWIDVPIHQLDTSFFLPVWVDEGDYTVYFRTIAENAPAKLDTEPDANRDLVNHVATDTVSVEVIGRLYDFHVTDIADYNWGATSSTINA
ncbi:MAG TPA: DUF5704 domain-containing protein [Paenibacillus sp.]